MTLWVGTSLFHDFVDSVETMKSTLNCEINLIKKNCKNKMLAPWWEPVGLAAL